MLRLVNPHDAGDEYMPCGTESLLHGQQADRSSPCAVEHIAAMKTASGLQALKSCNDASLKSSATDIASANPSQWPHYARARLRAGLATSP